MMQKQKKLMNAKKKKKALQGMASSEMKPVKIYSSINYSSNFK